MEQGSKLKFLSETGDQHISGDGAPDPRLHCILAVADQMFDAQMLLGPFEEQLDLPAVLVKRSNGSARAKSYCWSGTSTFCRILGL